MSSKFISKAFHRPTVIYILEKTALIATVKDDAEITMLRMKGLNLYFSDESYNRYVYLFRLKGEMYDSVSTSWTFSRRMYHCEFHFCLNFIPSNIGKNHYEWLQSVCFVYENYCLLNPIRNYGEELYFWSFNFHFDHLIECLKVKTLSMKRMGLILCN